MTRLPTFCTIVPTSTALYKPADWMNQPFTGFCLDSRCITPGQIFVSLSSLTQPCQQQQYIEQALQRGAIGVLVEQPNDEDPNFSILSDLTPEYGARMTHIKNLRQYLGQWQHDYLKETHPITATSQSLARVVAVTGTNGKTTITRLIAELLRLLGHRAAITGTTGNGILPNLNPATHTTPQALQFQKLYFDLSAQGAEFLAIEASSHGLEQGRLVGTPIEVAIFSNLSRDHLDYHHTMAAYAQAKAQLMRWNTLRHVIINRADEYADFMLNEAKVHTNQATYWTYDCRTDSSGCATPQAQEADYYINDLQLDLHGAQFTWLTPHGSFYIKSPLLGRFNVDNLVAALIAVTQLGFDIQQLVTHVPQLCSVPGRMQSVYDAQRLFIVDYAHTPDALQQVLESVRHHAVGQLWVVFGCGGERDRGKRSLMVQVAITCADHVILTTDNPRHEPLEQIFQDMRLGLDSVHCPVSVQEIEDRRLAIRTAVATAQSGDIVVIAGKGHEDYQEVAGVRHWFDDVVELNNAITHHHTFKNINVNDLSH